MTEQQTPDPWATPGPDPFTGRPKLKRYTIPDPDGISFGDAWAIKAATGIDVINPESTAQQLVALLWWAGRDDGLPLSVAKLYTARDVDFDAPEPDPAQQDGAVDPFDPETADTEADPTRGSGPERR